MKKILSFFLALAISSSLVFGQDAQKASDGKTGDKKKEQTAKQEPAKSDVKATTTKTKKDGTPDMRYKENKEAKKTAGPTKKDGTPDMRYKSNKKDAPKK